MTRILSLTLFVCCLSTSASAQGGADVERRITQKMDAWIEDLNLKPKQIGAMAAIRVETLAAIESLRSRGEFYVGSPGLKALREGERIKLDALLTDRQRAALRVRLDGN